MEVCQTPDDRFAVCEDDPLNPKRFELVPAHPIGVGAQRDLDEGPHFLDDTGATETTRIRTSRPRTASVCSPP